MGICVLWECHARVVIRIAAAGGAHRQMIWCIPLFIVPRQRGQEVRAYNTCMLETRSLSAL